MFLTVGMFLIAFGTLCIVLSFFVPAIDRHYRPPKPENQPREPFRMEFSSKRAEHSIEFQLWWCPTDPEKDEAMYQYLLTQTRSAVVHYASHEESVTAPELQASINAWLNEEGCSVFQLKQVWFNVVSFWTNGVRQAVRGVLIPKVPLE